MSGSGLDPWEEAAHQEPPFFPFGKKVAFGFSNGSRILFQCSTYSDAEKLTDKLNDVWLEWKSKAVQKGE